MAPNGFYNLSEGIEKVQKGLFALHVEIGAAYYTILKTFLEHEKCECSVLEGIIGVSNKIHSILGKHNTYLL